MPCDGSTMAVDKPRNRPTVPAVIPLVRAVYLRHCAGCCLHVITDDGNCEQRFAEHAIDRAQGLGHDDCLAAATAIAQMTNTQRLRLYRCYRQYAP